MSAVSPADWSSVTSRTGGLDVGAEKGERGAVRARRDEDRRSGARDGHGAECSSRTAHAFDEGVLHGALLNRGVAFEYALFLLPGWKVQLTRFLPFFDEFLVFLDGIPNYSCHLS